MKPIKLYELITLIEKGEAPKKVMYEDTTFKYIEDAKEYYGDKLDDCLFQYITNEVVPWLDEKVMIVEESEEVK